MISRREFLKIAGVVAVAPYACAPKRAGSDARWVNDVHTRLNRTRVTSEVWPDSSMALQDVIRRASQKGEGVSIAGGRHAMGGQQFGTDTVLLNINKHNRVLDFDSSRGIIDIASGIEWPQLVNYLVTSQKDRAKQWGIAQKQTGTDRLSIGGTVAANAHGRGLQMKPFVSDIESFRIVVANGEMLTCSRTENTELFRLVVGGYGLFGVVDSVRLRLVPRQKVERIVELIDVDDLMPAFEQRIQDGYLYGDCQYMTDETSDGYLRRGVFSCYRPIALDTPVPSGQKRLTDAKWQELIYLAHADKGEAFRQYSDYYLGTNGQVYWSDLHQLSSYMDDYHRVLDRKLRAANDATEIITEVYVPRDRLVDFMGEVREDCRQHAVNVIYGTIRLIERDDETFLPWAKDKYVSIIFNLHTVHTPEGIEHSARAFRRLIDSARSRGGNYFLTYHRFASREQVLSCYPQFVDFMKLKLKYDPNERFQSDWYRHYREMFADVI